MKNFKYYFIIILSALSFNKTFAQFTDPYGYSGSLKTVTQHINQGDNNTGIKWPKAIKWTTNNRRYALEITFKNNTWYSSGGCGWNKAARITFVRDNNNNENKMHIGWRAIESERNKLLLSLFFHDGPLPGGENNWVACKMYKVNTDSPVPVDMFLGHDIISMIIIDKSLALRKKGWIPGSLNKRSFLAKTFYFGGNCGAPQYMEAYFDKQFYDYAGYGIKFNSQALLIWNLSEFENGDNFQYYASKTINGSVKNPHDVEFNSYHPDPNPQKCIIHSGAQITFNAGQEVHLYPGFHAEEGSYFKADIIVVPAVIIKQTPASFAETIDYKIKNARSVELALYLDNTRDSLVYSSQAYIFDSAVKISIDTILPNQTYYAVADFYSGRGSKKRVSGFVSNSFYGLKENLLNSINKEKNKTVFNGVVIFPNPSKNIFNINSVSFIKSLYVYNSIGKLVLERQDINQKNITFDLKNHKTGLYYVKVETEQTIKTYKIVKTLL